VACVGLFLARGWVRHRVPIFGVAQADEEPSDAGLPAVCATGLEGIAGGGCFSAPESPGPWPLVLYLHGIYDPAAATEELDRQARVAELGKARGFAVLALTGHVGECSAPEYAARICWPSNEHNEGDAPAFVAEWNTPLAAAANRGASIERYVLGFSNGGYFAGLLAERALFDADAFVIARGGPVMPVKASGQKVPLLLSMSEDDPSYEEMQRLDTELTQAEWPHERYAAHGGHALPNGDITAALEFFSNQKKAGGARSH